MKKLAIFLPNLKVGGAERVITTLANYFANQPGMQVDIVLLEGAGDLIHELDKRVTVTDLGLKKMKQECFGLFKLQKYLRKEKPNSLLCVMWPLTIVGFLAKLLSFSKTNLIFSDHTTFSKSPWMQNKFKYLIFRLSVFLVYPFANYRLNVSDQASRDLEKLGWLKKNSITTIYNPVKIYPGEITNKKRDTVNIITVGSLKWAKNHELLLDAMELVIKKMPSSRLLIVGEGDRKTILQQRVADLGLDNHVVFCGQKNRQELESLYLSADLMVLSSHYEGFAMVILEAINYGVPVVSVDCDHGPREILADGEYGLLVPNHNAAKLAEGILAQCNKTHDVQKLRSRASDFSVDVIGMKYMQVL